MRDQANRTAPANKYVTPGKITAQVLRLITVDSHENHVRSRPIALDRDDIERFIDEVGYFFERAA